jgi:hypothetical protein
MINKKLCRCAAKPVLPLSYKGWIGNLTIILSLENIPIFTLVKSN